MLIWFEFVFILFGDCVGRNWFAYQAGTFCLQATATKFTVSLPPSNNMFILT
jgi:hypothetical protein